MKTTLKIKKAAKAKKESVVVESDKPIHVSLKLAGQDQEIDTDNILAYLRGLKIDRLKIKSNAQFYFTYSGKTFLKTLTIPQMKRFIGNDIYKMIIAKWVNQNLGITVDSYN